MKCNQRLLPTAVVAIICGAVCGIAVGGIPVAAEESNDYQRIASHRETPVEVTVDTTVLVQPGANSRVAVGGLELQLGLRLWDRWDVSATGRLPVDVVAGAGESYRVYRSTDPRGSIATGYSLGPPHQRHQVSASLDTGRSGSLSYVLATIRDPMVQAAGVSADVQLDRDKEWALGVSVPLSAALVVNDVTSLQAELSPTLTDVLRQPRSSLSAVVSVRWAWERFNIGSAALFGEQGAPGGMALSGGWKWRRDG